jgi:DNA polymerase-3 subunit beta
MFKIMQNRFEAAVKFLCSIAPKKSSLAILQNIKIIQTESAVCFEATDLDTFLRIKLPCWSDVKGEFAIDSKVFAKLSEKVATGISDGKVQFGKVLVPTADIKEFPSLETGFFKNPICTFSDANKNELIEAGKRVCDYAVGDPSRGVLEGICLKSGYLYATNGNFLARHKISLTTKKNQEFVIPKTFFKHLAAEFIIDPTVDITIYQADADIRYIAATGRGFELYSKLIVGDYPDIEKVLPKEMPFSFTINREQFLSVTKNATMYSGTSKNFMTDISIGKNNKEFQIKTCKTDDGVEFSDTIPIETKNKKKWQGIAFNAKYLSMILDDCKGSTVNLNAGENPIQAIVIEPLDDRMYYLLMPLRKIEDVEPAKENTNQESTEVSKNEKVEAVSA